MSAPTRALLSCAATFLDQGRIVNRLSGALTASAAVGIFVAPAMSSPSFRLLLASAVLVALAGVTEMYFAVRVRFDASLFRQLANAQQPDWAETDATLAALGLLPHRKRGRHPDVRIAGARRWFAFQVLALAAQMVCLAGTAWVALLRR